MRFAIMLLLACAAAAAPLARPSPTHTRHGAGPALSDAQLEKAIRAKLLKSKISADGFQVHVQGGVTSLEGKTDVLQHKGTATRLARAAGAVKVVNRIHVSQAARDKAAGNLAKGRRRAQVKRGQTTARSHARSVR